MPASSKRADDAASADMDCGFKVQVNRSKKFQVQDAVNPNHFIVYGGGAYTAPSRITEKRKLGPQEEPSYAFFAVFEFTSRSDWTHRGGQSKNKRKGLLKDLETRLALCRKRAADAQEKSENEVSILEIVAVVGVVGAYDCRQSVEDIMAAEMARTDAVNVLPNLSQMMQANRFVYFSANIAGGPAITA
jgi:hypothetical protein